jgi:hypothetical protein
MCFTLATIAPNRYTVSQIKHRSRRAREGREVETGEWFMVKELTCEKVRARGIAAMGRVERDYDGFTVYSTDATPPDAFRVWNDPVVGDRCTCAPFNAAFTMGDEFECAHILAVRLIQSPPDDEAGSSESLQTGDDRSPLRRVI